MILTTYESATGEHYSRKIESIEVSEIEPDVLIYSYRCKKGYIKRSVVAKTAITSIVPDNSYMD